MADESDGFGETLEVGLIVGRVQPSNRWADPSWRPVAILPAPAAAAPWTALGTEGLTERFYAGPVALAFHRSETANYRDNLATGRPLVWVALGAAGAEPPIDIRVVTADPAEGEALAGIASENVDTVPMPAEIAAALEAFVATHHVERAFYKRRRDEAPAAPACGIDGE
ncbi:DUF3305 domain-containing protein [Prosthecomicrobium hirschii]|uniref:DUF3305 domain-containing protein n=1 Tax=Prosthecodimorpha hirschii TaxID=665126 RepID=UPI0011265871|nr:DUF3305 domain-containing protein [Prosthecomicrobium hirschii]TPQ49123.1 DUF3305 domain-containing protein [Prosthecomicrobium hirschii]